MWKKNVRRRIEKAISIEGGDLSAVLSRGPITMRGHQEAARSEATLSASSVKSGATSLEIATLTKEAQQRSSIQGLEAGHLTGKVAESVIAVINMLIHHAVDFIV